MAAFLRIYSRIMSGIARLALYVAGAGLVAMMVFVAWMVFGRFILNDTPTWTEPAVLLLMSWFIILGAAVGVRYRGHLSFEIGLHVAPPPVRALMLLINEVVVGAFGLAMAWYGAVLAHGVWLDRTPMIGISKGWDYVPMSVGGVLIVLFAVEKLLELLAGRTEPTAEAEALPHADGA
jgi:TRAP-type C4-dicarboxylate transport system permease small subunit